MENEAKLYSQKAIGIATFFGGPLAAGYLIRSNFINLNKGRSGLIAMIIGILTTLILFAGIFLMPDSIIGKIPNSLFPAIYTIIIYVIVEKIQGADIKSHESNKGKFYSTWRAAGIGAIGTVVIGIIAFVSADLLGANTNFDADRYDRELATFFSNEEKALKIYSSEAKSEDQLKIELEEGLALWNKNQGILNSLNAIENLPSELINQNKVLMEYCDLRVEHYNFILKSIEEETDQYSIQIQELGQKIDLKLSEL